MLRTALEPFNIQPHAAAIVLGYAARFEEALKDGHASVRREDLSKMKTALSAALSALADPVFWGALRPASLAIAFAVGTGVSGFDLQRFLESPGWALAAFLAVYNLPGLWLRWWGIGFGYECGLDLPARIEGSAWRNGGRGIRIIGFGALCLSVLGLAWSYGVPVLALLGAGFLGAVLVGGLKLSKAAAFAALWIGAAAMKDVL